MVWTYFVLEQSYFWFMNLACILLFTLFCFFFFFNDPPPTEISPLPLPAPLPIFLFVPHPHHRTHVHRLPRRNPAGCQGDRQQQNRHANKCHRVVRTDSVEQTRQKTGQHEGAGNAYTDANEGHLEPLTDNQLENVPAIRPERDAHPKFTSSLAG